MRQDWAGQKSTRPPLPPRVKKTQGTDRQTTRSHASTFPNPPYDTIRRKSRTGIPKVLPGSHDLLQRLLVVHVMTPGPFPHSRRVWRIQANSRAVGVRLEGPVGGVHHPHVGHVCLQVVQGERVIEERLSAVRDGREVAHQSIAA